MGVTTNGNYTSLIAGVLQLLLTICEVILRTGRRLIGKAQGGKSEWEERIQIHVDLDGVRNFSIHETEGGNDEGIVSPGGKPRLAVCSVNRCIRTCHWSNAGTGAKGDRYAHGG